MKKIIFITATLLLAVTIQSTAQTPSLTPRSATDEFSNDFEKIVTSTQAVIAVKKELPGLNEEMFTRIMTSATIDPASIEGRFKQAMESLRKESNDFLALYYPNGLSKTDFQQRVKNASGNSLKPFPICMGECWPSYMACLQNCSGLGGWCFLCQTQYYACLDRCAGAVE